MRSSLFSATLFAMAFLNLAVLPATAKPLFVTANAARGGDGTSWDRALPALAPALAAARAGDAIWVRAGTLELDDTVRVSSGVALYGGFAGSETSPDARRAINFANETVLRIRRADASVVEISDAHDVRLDGFTFTGADGRPGVVLRRCPATVVLANCRIARNTAPEAGAGLCIRDRSQPQLRNVQLADNHATGDANGGGLLIDATSGVDWIDGIINGNIADGPRAGGALILSSSAVPTRLLRCDFYFNESGASGSALDVTGTLDLRDSVICSNLARTAAPGLPLAIHGEASRVVLSGSSYIIGNLSDRAAPRFASAVEGKEHCELRDDAFVSEKETGPAELTLFTQRNDLHTVMPDVFAPPLTTGEPAPGRWVRQTLPSRAGTAAYHCVYLPLDWQPGKKYPLLVGFPGNGPFRNRFGDRSGGMPEDNPMGIGVSGGRGFVVLGLGYLDSRKNLQPTGNWWGDVVATIAYTKDAVRFACEHYGADPTRVVLFGFSRSAIGASFIGLHDDTIAPLWRAFLCYDGWESQADMARNWYRHDQSSYHYDPKDFDGTGVARRFQRLAGRPLFILGGRGEIEKLNATLHWPVELLAKPHRNHNVSWALRATPERAQVRAWLERVLAPPAR
ncbi:MAG: hypothetical protein HY736_27775 [Verrucomicrobia bacterium]|nr:hypothetical protein [Verrucomicrobiota bacterium]